MKQKYDLTQGGILNRLLLVALPIMGTQLMQMTYNLTDMFWLGRVGSDVVAASGTAGMYLWLSNAFLFIGRTGSEIGVSQQLGKGDRKCARSYSQNALFLSVVLGVLFAAMAVLFSEQLISFFGIRESHVARDAANYLAVTGTAVPFTFVSGAVTGSFNASGNSRAPFLINSVGLAVNMILDPLLIFTMNFGIIGAAAATCAAQLIVCVLSVIAIRWKRTRPLGRYPLRFRPDWEKIRQIFRWSVPIATESMLFTFLSMIVSRLLSSFGAGAIAVNRVGVQVESLSWLIGSGFSSAVTAYVGQNYGAGKWARIRKGLRISSVSMAVWGVLVTFLLFFAGGALFSVFLPDGELVAMGAHFLRILAMCQIPGTLEGVGAGAFRGTGRTLPPTVASISANAFRVVLSYGLSRTSLGLTGIWLGVTIGAGIRGLWIFFWFLSSLRRQPLDDLPTARGHAEA